jgi:hypothetical protein
MGSSVPDRVGTWARLASSRSYEGDAIVLAGLCELRIFRQKPIAGVDGIDTLVQRDIDDALNVQIGAHRAFLRIQLIGLVRLGAVYRQTVLFGVDGDGSDAELI